MSILRALVASLFLCVAAPLATAQVSASVSGSIRNNQGLALCGLVLANGQFVFSCSPNGSYSLTVPLDGAGQITLYGFAEGHFPYKAVLTSGGTHNMTLSLASSAQPSNTNRDKSAQLIGGTWSFVYTILSTFTDRYTFTSVSSTPDSDGDYAVSGTSSTGRPAVGLYASRQNLWGVLYRGITIDDFYTFTFSNTNTVTGCYFLVNPSGSTNFSRCYSMSGTRSPPKAESSSGSPIEAEQFRLQQVLSDSKPHEFDPETLELYQRLKATADPSSR